MSIYNAAPYLADAIGSIQRQSFGDFEFLILDDGSTDGSVAVARAHAAQDPRIRLITRENRGLIASLNQLIGEARAPWIARMDADDIADPERFARQMQFLANHPDHGVIGSDCAMIGPDGHLCARPPLDRPLTHAAIVANLEAGPLLNHPSVIVASDLLRQVGGYRAAFAHAEDYDLWLRLAQVTQLANLPEKLMQYRIYPDQVSSRHIIAQARNAAIAWLAYRERQAGRPDPLGDALLLPADDRLDSLFGPGAAAYVQRRVVARSLFATAALTSEGWPTLLAQARRGGGELPLWRVAGRILRAGMPVQAGRLGLALLAGV